MGLPRMYTITEVAKIAHAPRSSVEYWVYSGKLASRKVGRRRLVSEHELRAFLQVDDRAGGQQ